MDKGFRTRLIVTIAMFIVAFAALYTFESIPFKIIYGVFSFIAAIELFSFYRGRRFAPNLILLGFMELLFLVLGVVFVSKIDVTHFWYIILGVPGYDISAYVFGKICGGKIIKKSRPFPRISKNKTWEGTVLGLAAAIGMVAGLMAFRGSFDTDFWFLLCGPLALIGDLFESFLKRQFKVKDSGEIIAKNKFFGFVEGLIGGRDGHGGYLDRVDSTAFAASILLIIAMIM